MGGLGKVGFERQWRRAGLGLLSPGNDRDFYQLANPQGKSRGWRSWPTDVRLSLDMNTDLYRTLLDLPGGVGCRSRQPTPDQESVCSYHCAGTAFGVNRMPDLGESDGHLFGAFRNLLFLKLFGPI